MRTTVYAGHEYICIIILNIRLTGDIRALSWNTDKMTNVFFLFMSAQIVNLIVPVFLCECKTKLEEF